MKDIIEINLMRFFSKMGALTSFTVLAIYFEKWWIIFFSLLFWYSDDLKLELEDE